MLPIPPSPRSDIERGRTVVRLADGGRLIVSGPSESPRRQPERDDEVCIGLPPEVLRILPATNAANTT